MAPIIRIIAAYAALAILCTTSFGQVNFAFVDNGAMPPEEVAGWDGDAIRIAFEGVGNTQNGVTFDSVAAGVYSKLEFDFELRVSPPDGLGADGIGFAYANAEIFGTSAENDPFPDWPTGEEPNLEGSVGVGFDTWMNNELDNPGATNATVPNSFSLHYDGQLLLSVIMEDYGIDDDWIENGNVKRAHIEIVPGQPDATISVTVTDTVTGQSVPAFVKEPLPGFQPYPGRITYKARTGGENSDHDVDNISLTLTPVGGGAPKTSVHYGKHVGGVAGNPCDFDGNGSLGLGDINLLEGAVNAGANEAKYDITKDGKVNFDDILNLVTTKSKLNTYIGDANLDGQFNSGDFVAVFTVGEYEDAVADNSTWGDGDWTGNADFDSGDFVAAFSQGGYEAGPRPAVSAVPEPTSVLLFMIGWGLFANRVRGRHA